jgi:uncharacterized membrane protein
MEYWKFLHILSMFGSVTLLVGTDLLIHRIVHTGDVGAIRRAAKAYKPLGNAGIALVSLGVVFGLVTAIVGPFDLTQTWLILAYVIVAALFTLGPIEGKLAAKVFAAAETSPEDAPSAELTAAIEDRTWTILMTISTLLYVAVIFVMVTKPFL